MSGYIRLLVTSLIVVLLPLPLQAQNLNIDLGDHWDSPTDAYGAASGQTGRWNNVESLGVTPNLVDTAAVPTAVSITVTAGVVTGWTGNCVMGDANDLLGDNVFTFEGTWTVNLAGLTNGIYEVFLYAPGNPAVATGNMLVNGIAIASIPGDSTCGLSEGVSWVSVTIAVVDGTLSLMGDWAGSGFDYAGLAGLQLRETIFTDGFESGDTSAWSQTVP